MSFLKTYNSNEENIKIARFQTKSFCSFEKLKEEVTDLYLLSLIDVLLTHQQKELLT